MNSRQWWCRWLAAICFLMLVPVVVLAGRTDASASATTGYRSAGTVSTDGSPGFTNLGGCQAAGDGQFCSRPTGTSYGNLYFSSFGTLAEFGIPAGSFVSRIHVRITGQTTGMYAGLGGNCLFPSDQWRFYGAVVSSVTTFANYTAADHLGCVNAATIDAQQLTFRLNYCCDTWSASIDNFEIAFDYAPPTAAGPAWVMQHESSSMPTAARSAAQLADGRVVAAGGYDSTTRQAFIYAAGQSSQGNWTPTAAPNLFRGAATINAINNGQQVLVAGGRSDGATATSERYDPDTDTWTQTASMAAARIEHASSLLPDGRVLITAGISNSGFLSTAEIYDPATNVWTATGPMTEARANHQQVTFTDAHGHPKVMVLGGGNPNSYLRSTDIYDPQTNLWSPGPSMAATRYRPAAVLLRDGRILVAGGGGIDPAEIYDPATGQWTASATSEPITTASAVVLNAASGYQVLVAGTYTGTPVAMLFDPASNTWSSTVPMNIPRYDFAFSLLHDGTVLASGGLGLYTELGMSDRYLPAGITVGRPIVIAISPASGPLAGGTTVTITGTGFSGATSVKFATSSASFTVNSPTSITATAPPGSAGSVDITVTTPSGTSTTTAADRYTYTYAFGGFLQPVDSPPTFNQMGAGGAVPIKFNLGADYGPNIFASGYPVSQQITYNGSPLDDIEQTVTAGASALSYDPASNTYTYVWKTDKTWKATYRAITFQFTDGTSYTANFKFK